MAHRYPKNSAPKHAPLLNLAYEEVGDPRDFQQMDPSAENLQNHLKEFLQRSGRRGHTHRPTPPPRRAAKGQKVPSKWAMVRDKGYYLILGLGFLGVVVVGLMWLTRYVQDHYEDLKCPDVLVDNYPFFLSTLCFLISVFLCRMDFFGLI